MSEQREQIYDCPLDGVWVNDLINRHNGERETTLGMMLRYPPHEASDDPEIRQAVRIGFALGRLSAQEEIIDEAKKRLLSPNTPASE